MDSTIEIQTGLIPEFTPAVLELAKGLVPIRDGFTVAEKIDPVKASYLWANAWKPVREVELVTEIVTYHTFGYHGLFKPSVAEVAAQIPGRLVGKVDAFEVFGPKTADDLNKQREFVEQGYHKAMTRLYRWK